MKNTRIPKATKKQKTIIYNLYKFRFLNTKHFKKILGHKNHHRINEWLTDLIDKKCIAKIEYPGDVTKPDVYCLNTKAKYILRENGIKNEKFFRWLYKEKGLSENFINHQLSIADTYLFFLSQKEKDDSLQLFSKHELKDFEYFPEELPDSYIVVKSKKKTNRYFLHMFEPYTPKWVLRKAIKKYISYFESGDWKNNTKEKFPKILLVSPDENTKKHLNFFTKSKLNIFEEDLSFFLTTKEKLQDVNKDSIWQKVE